MLGSLDQAQRRHFLLKLEHMLLAIINQHEGERSVIIASVVRIRCHRHGRLISERQCLKRCSARK